MVVSKHDPVRLLKRHMYNLLTSHSRWKPASEQGGHTSRYLVERRLHYDHPECDVLDSRAAICQYASKAVRISVSILVGEYFQRDGSGRWR